MEVGEKINGLTYLKDAGIKNGRHYGLFECECGNRKEIRIDHVLCGFNKYCGCKQNVINGKGNLRHGICYTRIYGIWEKMKRRCYSPSCRSYKHYGGRGIKMCDEWKNPKVFYDWAINNGYMDNLSIDRIDVNGNYEPSNCRWATNKEQANNKRCNIYISRNGITKTLAQWCEELNVPYARIQRRIYLGWKEEDLFLPVGAKRDK